MASGPENRPADWDAAGYAQAATPQREWSGGVLARLRLEGRETVLDAGCGSGGVTAELLELLPEGKVIALDGSPAMIAESERRLADLAAAGRVEFTCQDLASFKLARRVDRVFSNAVLHWVPDHPSLFRRFAECLSSGGRLVAQYGGSGNVFPDFVDRTMAAMGNPETFEYVRLNIDPRRV